MSHPRLIFGCALIGMHGFENADSFGEALATLKETGISQLDTAARYPPPKQGESERLIGQTKAGEQGFTVDSKVLMGAGDGSGELETQAIDFSVAESLQRLGIKQVNTLYCHRFDPKTPLEETAAAMNKHYQKGHFKQWGVCRFPVEKLEELLRICDEKGYLKPSKYQGEYNVLTRGMETAVLPVLRAHGMHYNAHRPFATGFLTGRFTHGETEGTRFAFEHPLHLVFRQEYDKGALHKAITDLEGVLEPHGISPHEASIRWVVYHSALGPGDGVIFGSSKTSQIKENAASVKRGPLPTEVVSKMDELWLSLKGTREQVL